MKVRIAFCLYFHDFVQLLSLQDLSFKVIRKIHEIMYIKVIIFLIFKLKHILNNQWKIIFIFFIIC